LRNPDVILTADPYIRGTWQGYWRESWFGSIMQVDYPFGVPVGLFHTDRPRTYTGLNFLACTDFREGGGEINYWENQAFNDRVRWLNLFRSECRVHPYPTTNKRDIYEQAERMLCVTGNGCGINLQTTECLAAGVIPVIPADDDALYQYLLGFGFENGVNCVIPGRPRDPASVPTREAVLELANKHSYAVRARQLVEHIVAARRAARTMVVISPSVARNLLARGGKSEWCGFSTWSRQNMSHGDTNITASNTYI
jgi:hypothetical protein